MNNILSRIVIRNAKNINRRFMATKNEDVSIHTGQKWDSDDYRMARFINAPKIVNPNWPINMLAKQKPKQVPGRKVWCDGGSGPEGHPRIYINLDQPSPQYCMYCNQAYIQITTIKKPDPSKKK